MPSILITDPLKSKNLVVIRHSGVVGTDVDAPDFEIDLVGELRGQYNQALQDLLVTSVGFGTSLL